MPIRFQADADLNQVIVSAVDSSTSCDRGGSWRSDSHSGGDTGKRMDRSIAIPVGLIQKWLVLPVLSGRADP